MTQILADLLEATEPSFRQQLHQLERVNGHNNVDIRLTVEVVQAAKRKLRELGLDQYDTTAEELYQALQQRISADDQRLERILRTRAATYVSAEADITAGIVHAVQAEAWQAAVLALKPAALKRLLKKFPAKRLQKSLGYRSIDAMLRQEPVALLAGAARYSESAAWRRQWFDAYRQLSPADFETRKVQVLSPNAQRWQNLAQKITAEQAHTVIGLPEMGAIVIMPLPAGQHDGMVVATMALALHELNDIAAAGTYLQASQVQADFGSRLQATANRQIRFDALALAQAMPWTLVQRYFAMTEKVINHEIFGPHATADFSWLAVEQKLAELCPSLAFWQDSAFLTFIEAGRKVSLNLVDAATDRCNRVGYEARGVYHAQQALWNELLLRYIDHGSLEQAVATALHPQLALEREQA